jgi:hypothetical protein
MKRIFQIALALVISLMMLSFGYSVNTIKGGPQTGFSYASKEDTTGIFRFLKVDTFNLTILPPSSGVQFYKDRIVFLSNSKNERKMSPNQISFGIVEAYSAPVEDTVTGRHTVFSPLSSFPYPCEAMTFSSDYSTVYFTKISKKEKKEKIYMARFATDSKSQNGLLSETNPLDFCIGNFAYSHPALSSDENMIIFASNREGSIGGMDLFVSKKIGDKWSAPEDLGRLINTNGNEFFPFLDSENNLYFSSDRLPGYGGYDIFCCKFNGTGWDSPNNLSDHINTFKDEIAFTINKMDGKTAFFTRRQQSGRGDMQLFRIALKREIQDRNLMTVSDIIISKTASTSSLTASNISNEIKNPVTETVKSIPETKQVKKEETKVPETTPILKKTIETTPSVKAENKIKPVENNIVAVKPESLTQNEKKDVVVYRIQLLPNANQKRSREIVINGTVYKIYEYSYLGVIRYTIGELSTRASASTLQKLCRQSGYEQSFVVAFKNNTRSLDPALFK